MLCLQGKEGSFSLLKGRRRAWRKMERVSCGAASANSCACFSHARISETLLSFPSTPRQVTTDARLRRARQTGILGWALPWHRLPVRADVTTRLRDDDSPSILKSINARSVVALSGPLSQAPHAQERDGIATLEELVDTFIRNKHDQRPGQSLRENVFSGENPLHTRTKGCRSP